MSEVTSSQSVNGHNSPHIEPLDICCISDDRNTNTPIDTYVPPEKCLEPSYQRGEGRPEPIKGDRADERENYDPCLPYTGCTDAVPSIGCGRRQGDKTPSEAHTLELNLEDAERFMPQPTTRAPWFGYESYADYGEDGWDAVADGDDGETGKDTDGKGGASAGGCEADFSDMVHIGDTYQAQGGQTNATTTDNDTVDVKNPTANIGNDYNSSDHASARGEGKGEKAGSGGGEGGERSGGSGGGRAGSKK